MSIDELHNRWATNMRYIAAEADYMAVHLARFNAVQGWLRHGPHRRVVNRSLQAYGWVASLWSDVATMYIRRELDDQHGTASLRQLFREMETRPDAVSGISAAQIVADRGVLERWCAGSAEWANRQVAHRTHHDGIGGGRFDDIFVAIQALVSKYHPIILGQPFVFEQQALDPYWLIGFTAPWYKPKKKLRVRFD